MRFLLPVLASLLFSAPAWALPEAELAGRYEGEILPFCLAQLSYGELVGEGGATLAYAELRVDEPRGALVVVPGRGDPFLKFCELVVDLQDEGYDIYLLDHRGHGFSGPVIDDPYKIHVDAFDDYVADLDHFLAEVVEPVGYLRVVGLAHSMGGAIATLQEERDPGSFDALVLSAPMHAVGTVGIPEPLAYSLVKKLVFLGFGMDYAISQGPPDVEAGFLGNRETHSQARWDAFGTLVDALPELLRGQSTNRWTREALAATRELRAQSARLQLPVLLFQADQEHFVENWGQDWVCWLAPECEKRFLPGSFHQLLVERDAIRDQILDGVRELLI